MNISLYLGAGKTTLIEILAGKSKVGRLTGEVAFPATEAGAKDPTIGFVPQQDILPAKLTVAEAILFAARLRLPESIPFSEQIARVDDVIEKLGLSHVRNVRIGDGEKRGISGGEMRRVSIGLELVARPDVLLLDEPTSGLDSVSASKVARVLHGLAHDPESPTAVIASIHQPRWVVSLQSKTSILTFVAQLSVIPNIRSSHAALSWACVIYRTRWTSPRGLFLFEGYLIPARI